MAKNYYLILGVPFDASVEEIKSAYRRQAKELHPDLTGGDCGRFLDLQEAYAAISNERRLDVPQPAQATTKVPAQTRVNSVESLRAEPLSSEPVTKIPRFRSSTRNISILESFDSFRPSFGATIDRLEENFRRPARTIPQDARALTIEVLITVHQARAGGRAHIMIPIRAKCSICRGRGRVGCYECGHCRGVGMVVDETPISVRFPPVTRANYSVELALDHLGIHNLYLDVRFRISREYL